MTKEQAQGRVAAILAFDSFNHKGAAAVNPNLRQNTKEALQLNAEAAEALGIGEPYRAACSTLNV
jgi:hypothetical protein